MKIGIYNPNLSTMGGGEKVCLALAEVLSSENDVLLLTFETQKKKKLEDYFGINLKKVEIVVLPRSEKLAKIQHSRKVPNHLKKALENNYVYRTVKKLNLDMFINNAYNTEIPSPAPIGVFMCMFPHKLLNKADMSLIKKKYISVVDKTSRAVSHPNSESWLDTYQLITANSAFTQKYIKEYWNRDSKIIYPISDSKKIDVKKEKVILNVGRFFHNNGITHHKRQDFLVEAFKSLTELHEKGWELHFAGTLNNNGGDMAYAIDLIRKSEGYPIFYHFDTPLDGLKKLYSHAEIYWHATGFGADKEKNPERQEHFGISTVEAMSAGAVPVVIRSAGQEEIVQEGINGYLWDTQKQLINKTLQAIEKGDKLSNQAVKDAKRYGKSAFKESVTNVFAPLYNSTSKKE